MMTAGRPWRIHSSNKPAAVTWVRVVLQIYHCYDSDHRPLAVLTLPDKIRHGKATKIEITISTIFGDRSADLLHDSVNNAWWYDYTPFVVEQDVELSFAPVRASHSAH